MTTPFTLETVQKQIEDLEQRIAGVLERQHDYTRKATDCMLSVYQLRSIVDTLHKAIELGRYDPS